MGDRLIRRGDIWYVWGFDRFGKRWRESTKQRDKTAARHVAREITRRRAAEVFPAAEPPLPLREALNRLEAADKRASKSEQTRAARDNHARHLTRILGATFDVREASRADLERYVDTRLEEKVTRLTIQKELTTLRMAMGLADVWRRTLWPDLGRDVYVPRDRFLTPDELEKLLAQLTPDRRAYVEAFCFIGGRRAEMYRITDADIDWDGGRVRVVESKRGKKVRWVPLSARAAEALKKAPGAGSGGPLFPEWENAHRDLERACKRAEIAPVTWNDLRRTFQSWLAQGGADVLSVSKLAGTSVRMVEQVYARLGIDTLKSAIDKLPGGAYSPSQDATRRS